MTKIIRINREEATCEGCVFENVSGCRSRFDCVNPTTGIFVEVDEPTILTVNGRRYTVESITEHADGVTVEMR